MPMTIAEENEHYKFMKKRQEEADESFKKLLKMFPIKENPEPKKKVGRPKKVSVNSKPEVSKFDKAKFKDLKNKVDSLFEKPPFKITQDKYSKIVKMIQNDEYEKAEQELAPYFTEPKKRGRPQKDANIMKARTDIKNNILTTEMNVKGGLSDKVKKALKESIMGAIESKIKGGSITDTYDVDYYDPVHKQQYNKMKNAYLNNKDSKQKKAGKDFYDGIEKRDVEIAKKKRGRPRKIKGRGLDDEFEDEIEENAKTGGIGSIELQRKNQQIGNVKYDNIAGYYASLMKNTAMNGLRDNM